MHQHAGRQRQPGGEQDGRPVDRVEARDPLADHVDALVRVEPPALEGRVVARVPELRDVVRQRVEPDVDGLRRIARHRDAPAAGALAGARHADVVEPAPQHGEHLVAPRLGLHAQHAGLDGGQERLPVAREAEEPVALGDVLQGRGVLGAAAVDELVPAEERLAARAVAALVVALVQVAGGRAGVPQPLDAGAMARVDAGADEGVVRQLERLAQGLEAGGARVDERRHGLPRCLGGQHVLERVVVGAAEVAHRLPPRAAVARDGVGLDELERVPEVRIAVDVRDRVGDVGRAHRSLLASPRRGHDRCAAAPELGAWSARAYARTPSDPAGRAIMRRAVARAVMDTG